MLEPKRYLNELHIQYVIVDLPILIYIRKWKSTKKPPYMQQHNLRHHICLRLTKGKHSQCAVLLLIFVYLSD